MKQDVFITIRGTQNADGEKETTELFTQGKFYRKNGIYYITYEESEATGFAGCKTTLKVEPDKVTLIRGGATSAHLIVERGERNVGIYGTPAGMLQIGVDTHALNTALSDDGGELHFSYALDINSSLISENEIRIEVKRDAGASPVHPSYNSTGMEYPQ